MNVEDELLTLMPDGRIHLKDFFETLPPHITIDSAKAALSALRLARLVLHIRHQVCQLTTAGERRRDRLVEELRAAIKSEAASQQAF